MSYFYIFCIILSIVLTIIVLEKFELKGHVRLTLLNIFIPFGGLVYALYVVHFTIPRLVEQQTGVRPPSPLQPYIEQGLVHIKPLVEKLKVLIFGNKDDHRID